MHDLKRKDGEKFEAFVTRLRIQGDRCGYDLTNREAVVLECAVARCRDKELQKKFFTKPELTLQKAVELANHLETTRTQLEDLNKPPTLHYSRGVAPRTSPRQLSASHQSQRCSRCSSTSHQPATCPFKNSSCYSCGKVGHTQTVCRAKAQSQAERCDRCSGTSHVSASCPFKKASCYSCGKVGHTQTVCRVKQPSRGQPTRQLRGHRSHFVGSTVQPDEYELFGLHSQEGDSAHQSVCSASGAVPAHQSDQPNSQPQPAQEKPAQLKTVSSQPCRSLPEPVHKQLSPVYASVASQPCPVIFACARVAPMSCQSACGSSLPSGPHHVACHAAACPPCPAACPPCPAACPPRPAACPPCPAACPPCPAACPPCPAACPPCPAACPPCPAACPPCPAPARLALPPARLALPPACPVKPPARPAEPGACPAQPTPARLAQPTPARLARALLGLWIFHHLLGGGAFERPPMISAPGCRREKRKAAFESSRKIISKSFRSFFGSGQNWSLQGSKFQNFPKRVFDNKIFNFKDRATNLIPSCLSR